MLQNNLVDLNQSQNIPLSNSRGPMNEFDSHTPLNQIHFTNSQSEMKKEQQEPQQEENPNVIISKEINMEDDDLKKNSSEKDYNDYLNMKQKRNENIFLTEPSLIIDQKTESNENRDLVVKYGNIYSNLIKKRNENTKNRIESFVFFD